MRHANNFETEVLRNIFVGRQVSVTNSFVYNLEKNAITFQSAFVYAVKFIFFFGRVEIFHLSTGFISVCTVPLPSLSALIYQSTNEAMIHNNIYK